MRRPSWWSRLRLCSRPVEAESTAASPPPRLPSSSVPTSLTVGGGLVVQPNLTTRTANAFKSVGEASLVVEAGVWELRKADRLVGALEVVTLDNRRVDTARDKDRAAIRGQVLAGRSGRNSRWPVFPVWSTIDGDRALYVWYGVQVLGVLQVKADEIDPDDAARSLSTRCSTTVGPRSTPKCSRRTTSDRAQPAERRPAPRRARGLPVRRAGRRRRLPALGAAPTARADQRQRGARTPTRRPTRPVDSHPIGPPGQGRWRRRQRSRWRPRPRRRSGAAGEASLRRQPAAPDRVGVLGAVRARLLGRQRRGDRTQRVPQRGPARLLALRRRAVGRLRPRDGAARARREPTARSACSRPTSTRTTKPGAARSRSAA